MGSVMKLFGWRNPAVAAQYIKYLPEDVRKEYDRAFSNPSNQVAPLPKTVSLDDFFTNVPQLPSKRA